MNSPFCCLLLCCLFTLLNVATAQIDGLPGTSKTFREYRTPNSNGVNIHKGMPRFQTTMLPFNNTNGQQVASYITHTFSTNLTLDIDPGGVVFLPFEFENSASTTFSEMTLQTVMEGTAVPMVGIRLNPPKGSGQIVYNYPSGSSSNPGLAPHVATVTFSEAASTNACSATFAKYRSFTSDFTETVKPCTKILLKGRKISGTWVLVLENPTKVFNGLSQSFPVTLRGFTVTITANEVGAVVYNGKTWDLRPRSIRELDYTTIDPNLNHGTGGVVVKRSRAETER